MKIKKRLAMKNISVLFTAACIAISMLCGDEIEAAGMPLPYCLLLVAALLYAGCWIWNIRRGERGVWRLECRTDLLVLVLFAWNLLSVLGKIFLNPAEAFDYRFQAVWIVCGLLYFEFKEVREIKDWYWDLILYTGLVVTGRLLIGYLCGWQTGWLAELFSDSGKAASYLLLPCTLGVLRYCFCRDRLRSLFYLMIAALGFFALFINYNLPSLWIMVFVFLAIPVVIRPTAELVKRDMQLFFVYGFMLSNMSLLTNYTSFIRKELPYALEHSVYLELLLAVGGVVFFQYWDRIPEDVDKEKLVLRRMRRGYRFLLLLLGIVFAVFVAGGGVWAGLPDTPEASVRFALVKGFAAPLCASLSAGKNAWLSCLEHSGVSTLLLLLLAVSLIQRIVGNCNFAKPQTTGFMLLSGVFLMQTVFLTPSVSVVPVYLLFSVWAAYYREQKQYFTVRKINIRQEEWKR